MTADTVQDRQHRALVRDLDLLALGRDIEGERVPPRLVAVQRVEDGLRRRHTSIDLPLFAGTGVLDEGPGRFVGPGQHTPEHDGGGARDQGQEDILIIADASIRDDRHRVSHRAPRLTDRLELRDAGSGLESRATASPGADAHLDRIRAEVSEERGALGRPHVSADEGYIAQLGPNRLHGPPHDLRVPVSDVDQDHVRATA